MKFLLALVLALAAPVANAAPCPAPSPADTVGDMTKQTAKKGKIITADGQTPQVFEIAASPRQRWELANLLFHRDLKLTEQDERQLVRAREAFALVEPSLCILDRRPASQLADDRRTEHRFTVTAENRDFVLTRIRPLEMASYQRLILAALFEDLDACRRGEPRALPENLPPLDLASEAWPAAPALPATGAKDVTCPGCGQAFALDELEPAETTPA